MPNINASLISCIDSCIERGFLYYYCTRCVLSGVQSMVNWRMNVLMHTSGMEKHCSRCLEWKVVFLVMLFQEVVTHHFFA